MSVKALPMALAVFLIAPTWDSLSRKLPTWIAPRLSRTLVVSQPETSTARESRTAMTTDRLFSMGVASLGVLQAALGKEFPHGLRAHLDALQPVHRSVV